MTLFEVKAVTSLDTKLKIVTYVDETTFECCDELTLFFFLLKSTPCFQVAFLVDKGQCAHFPENIVGKHYRMIMCSHENVSLASKSNQQGRKPSRGDIFLTVFSKQCL